MRIAFDLDDTLWKIVEDTQPRLHGVGAMCACGVPVRQEVDQELSSLVHSLIVADHKVIIWSAGGVEYVKNWIRTFSPGWEASVEILPKEAGHDIDITIDDQEITLGKVNLRVKREHADHWQQEDKAP